MPVPRGAASGLPGLKNLISAPPTVPYGLPSFVTCQRTCWAATGCGSTKKVTPPRRLTCGTCTVANGLPSALLKISSEAATVAGSLRSWWRNAATAHRRTEVELHKGFSAQSVHGVFRARPAVQQVRRVVVAARKFLRRRDDLRRRQSRQSGESSRAGVGCCQGDDCQSQRHQHHATFCLHSLFLFKRRVHGVNSCRNASPHAR